MKLAIMTTSATMVSQESTVTFHDVRDNTPDRVTHR